MILVARNLTEFVVTIAICLIVIILIKIVVAIKKRNKMPTHQDLVKKGIFPTIRISKLPRTIKLKLTKIISKKNNDIERR